MPDVFITLSINTAAEGFPVGKSIADDSSKYYGADCYAHFRTLEFLAEGILCGWRGSRENWRNHLLRVDYPRDMQMSTAEHYARCHNVVSYINRYEWQKRGVLHCHLIVWVKDKSRIL